VPFQGAPINSETQGGPKPSVLPWANMRRRLQRRKQSCISVMPLNSKQKTRRDSSRKIGAQNDSYRLL
jgi:hypothetical protein